MGNICDTINNKNYLKIKRSGESVALSAGRFWGSQKGEAGYKRLVVARRGTEKDCRSPLNTRGQPGSPLS